MTLTAAEVLAIIERHGSIGREELISMLPGATRGEITTALCRMEHRMGVIETVSGTGRDRIYRATGKRPVARSRSVDGVPEYLPRDGVPRSIGELSETTGRSRKTLQNLLRRLQARGAVVRLGDPGAYRYVVVGEAEE